MAGRLAQFVLPYCSEKGGSFYRSLHQILETKMKLTLLRNAVASIAMAAACASAGAVPQLQLGILNGTYDATTETIIAGSNPFTLYAFLTPKDDKGDPLTPEQIDLLLKEDYYISAALVPKTGPSSSTLGSFTFDGTTVTVTDDMDYGTPPLDDMYAAAYGDLSPHGIFETYFSEHKFQFDKDHTAGLSGSGSCGTGDINTQDDPSLGCLATGGAGAYGQFYKSFVINVANLSTDVVLHFDLYNTKVRDCKANENCSEVASTDGFAPFSHDAQSSSSNGGSSQSSVVVPEPSSSSLALLGLALVLGGLAQRRRARRI